MLLTGLGKKPRKHTSSKLLLVFTEKHERSTHVHKNAKTTNKTPKTQERDAGDAGGDIVERPEFGFSTYTTGQEIFIISETLGIDRC